MSASTGKALVQSEAGEYLAWSSAELAVEGFGCGLLVLKPLGFALPHYADSSKFGYVLGGSGVAGILPAGVGGGAAADRERVVRLVAGDVVVARLGDVSWWYNDGADGDLSIVFIGDTARAVSPGDISYFFVAGANGVLSGLDAGVMAKAWGLTEEQAAAGFRSQPAVLLTKLAHKLDGVRTPEHDRTGFVLNAAHVPPDVVTDNAVLLKTLTAARLPALHDLGFSAGIARLDAGAVRAPWVLREGAAQVVYVVRGSGRVKITAGAAAALDAAVSAGSLFVVPRFAATCIVAGPDGMEWVSLTKSPRPAPEPVAGTKGSVLAGLTVQAVQAALSVAPELTELLRGAKASS